MSDTSAICIDASFAIKLVAEEELSAEALLLSEAWARDQRSLVAPLLIRYEVVSALRQKIRRSIMTEPEVHEALTAFLELPMSVTDYTATHVRALQLAVELGLGSTYDAHYLALAEDLNCEFWTADGRLYNAIKDRFPLIHSLAEPV